MNHEIIELSTLVSQSRLEANEVLQNIRLGDHTRHKVTRLINYDELIGLQQQTAPTQWVTLSFVETKV